MTIEERVEFLWQSIESHDRQLGEIGDRIAETTVQIADLNDAIKTLVNVSSANATAIQAVARVAGEN